MRTTSTDIGETIKIIRKEQNISRKELAESAGISISHLEKIEAGIRRPGIDTYQRIVKVLKTDMIMCSGMATVKEKCVVKAQEILMNSTETQALYLLKVLEFSAKNINDAGWD